MRSGKKRFNSPIAKIIRKTGCSSHYPSLLYEHWLATGSLEPKWAGGRPPRFSVALWKAVEAIIREARERQERASAPRIRAKLIEMGYSPVPSIQSIKNWKRDQGFEVVVVETKPFLTKVAMAERVKFAKAMLDADTTRLVVLDEKWFSEEKSGTRKFEARPDDDVPPEVRFMSGKAETRTQLQKIMFLVVVSPNRRVMIEEMDWRSFSNSKGINSAYFITKVEAIHKAAIRALGSHGPVDLMLDRAPCHKSKATMKVLTKYFRHVYIQPASSPDFNMLDAGVFPFMERECNKNGTKTLEAIRATVKGIWERVTPEFCSRVMGRVKRNMQTAIDLKGGNYYRE